MLIMTVNMIMIRRKRWSKYVARMGLKFLTFCLVYMKERAHLPDVVIDGKIVFNWL